MIKFNSVRNIKLAEHCQTPWNELKSTGDDRIRRCPRCGELVFQINTMEPEKALEFVGRQIDNQDDLILYIRTDGTVKARDTRCQTSSKLIERFMKLTACFTL